MQIPQQNGGGLRACSLESVVVSADFLDNEMMVHTVAFKNASMLFFTKCPLYVYNKLNVREKEHQGIFEFDGVKDHFKIKKIHNKIMTLSGTRALNLFQFYWSIWGFDFVPRVTKRHRCSFSRKFNFYFYSNSWSSFKQKQKDFR